ncbi:MAG: metalloregulator ArsR/SmtB family transcription factor [Chloroflexi bacterium]|nr:metalloregulator ArsR/SmtB family transcription factor [Chloroflexota bacterium]
MDEARHFQTFVYERLARLASAVAHPRRLELVDLLCQGPMTVEQLAQKSGMPFASASQHLQHLRMARLVEGERQGSYVCYRLVDDAVTCDLLAALQRAAARYDAEVRAAAQGFLQHYRDVESVDLATLRERMRQEPLLLIDVRPAEEYAAGHWPGAWSLPLEDLANRLAELPRDRAIAAYCRGPYCVLAVHAVNFLRQQGFRAFRLIEGVGEWRSRGEMIAVGDEIRQT